MKLILVALTLCLAAVVFDPSMPVQQSYELRCRGGGLKFNSTPGRTLPTGEQMMNVTIDFVAGTQGAAVRRPNLNPGQCSWIDRGFRQGEPTQIRLEMVSFGQQQQALHGSPVDRSPTAAERYPDAQNVPQYLSNSDRYWTFWVYNTNNGYMQATGNKYFKPLIVVNPKDIKILNRVGTGRRTSTRISYSSQRGEKMITAKRFLLLSVTSLLLLAGLSLSLRAQDPPKGYHPNPNATPLPTPTPIAAPDYQPLWAVNGKIRWKKEYGVVPVSTNLQDSINNRCISFYVAALDPVTNAPLRGDHSQMFKADDEGDYYVCRYTLKLPANRQVRVIASMGGDGLLPKIDPNPLFTTRAWIGGNPSQSRPPQGGMRAFTGSKYVMLDRRTTRASVDFELYYALPRSDGPR